MYYRSSVAPNQLPDISDQDDSEVLYKEDSANDPSDQKLHFLNKVSEGIEDEDEANRVKSILNKLQFGQIALNSSSILPEVSTGVKYSVQEGNGKERRSQTRLSYNDIRSKASSQ